jgi:hypothetical protein
MRVDPGLVYRPQAKMQRNFTTNQNVLLRCQWEDLLASSSPVCNFPSYRCLYLHLNYACNTSQSDGYVIKHTFVPHGATTPSGPGLPHCRGFTITLIYITLGGGYLNEWFARSRDLCLITYDNSKRLTSMLSAGFEPAIPASKLPLTQALDRVATVIGYYNMYHI